jgi:Ser/Thr protein kinase RdoA (MazF antagonist)
VWEVFHAYGWTPTSVQHRGGVWEIIDGGHKYALKESSATQKKLRSLHQMLEQVRAAGFPHLLPWIEAEDGEVIVSAYGSQWYATPWKELSDDHVLSATKLASSLGLFHRLAEPVAAEFPKLHQVISSEEKETWKQRQIQVSQWNSSSHKAHILSDSSPDLSDNSFSFAMRGLDRYVAAEKGVAPRYTICHERVHPSNVLASEDGLYWIDFDHAELNTPIKDLATLIHRFPEESATEILAHYEQENKLLPKEKRLLAVFLSYPERLVRAAERQAEDVDLSREFAHVGACFDLAKNLWPVKKKADAGVKSGQKRRKR